MIMRFKNTVEINIRDTINNVFKGRVLAMGLRTVLIEGDSYSIDEVATIARMANQSVWLKIKGTIYMIDLNGNLTETNMKMGTAYFWLC